MNRNLRIVTMLGMAMGLWTVVPATAGARHRIKFDRTMKVGDRYSLKVAGAFSGKTLIEAGTQKIKDEQEKYSFQYEAVVKVLRVDAKGRSIRETHKVVRLTRTSKGKRTTLLKPGTVLTAWVAAGNKKFSTTKGAVTGKARDILSSAVDFPHSSITTDDVFGSRRKRRIGERWSINTKLALQEISAIFKRKKLPGSARATGHVKLTGRAREAGIRCLKLTNKMTIIGLSPLPPSFLLDKAHVQASGQWLLPVNLRLPPAKMKMRLLVDIKARMPARGPRPAVRIKMRIERTVTGRIKRLGRTP